jgi:hypothetical protein
VALLLALVLPVSAGPAVRFLVSNDPCLIQTCVEHPPPPKTVVAGKSFQVYVSAQDAGNVLDITYVASVVVSSSDSAAVLPSNLNFATVDQGTKQFTAIFKTPGDQTITLTDSLHNITGSLTMTVTPDVTTIPVLSDLAKFLLVLILAATGIRQVWSQGN